MVEFRCSLKNVTTDARVRYHAPMKQPRAYYNEFDPKTAAWLKELIKGGVLQAGEVDTRSIKEVTPADLDGFTHCHFFAGIGGWAYALRLAGWPDDRPAWTGSCPCQPFSLGGEMRGFDDERHLWPDWHWLIAQHRPATIFGEQVTRGAAKAWLDLVATDLEGLGYAFGAANLCGISVSAPHERQRVFFVGHADGTRLDGRISEASIYESRDCSPWASSMDIRNARQDVRKIEPGIDPLAHGVPERVGLLRGYGNAIIPQAGATFIKSVM